MTVDKQEIVEYMITEKNRNHCSEPYQLADKAADMFDLWEESWEYGGVDPGLPMWLLDAAEDIFYD